MKQQNKAKRVSNKRLIPIIGAIGLIPLIVHMYTYNTGLEIYDWFPNNSTYKNDFFMVWKAIGIILLGIIILAIMLYQKMKEKNSFQFENSFYFLFFYMLFVIMSALLSPYKHWALLGTFELFEPIWVLLAYIIICYYTYNTVREEKHLDIIIGISGIGIAIGLIIGTFQTFGFDFFQTHIGKLLITNPTSWDRVDDMEFAFGRRAYMTLYNPDYIIFYTGIILPVLIAVFINSKKIISKVIVTILCVFTIICLIGGRTTTGWLAILISGAIGLLVILSRNKKYFRIGISVIVIVGIAGGIFLFSSSSMKSLKDTIMGTYKLENAFGIKSITTNSDICINYNELNTHFQYDADSEQGTMTVFCTDDNDNSLAQSTNSEGQFVFKDANSAEYLVEAVYIENTLAIRITIDDHQWVFAKQDDGNYKYFNAAGKYVDFPISNQAEFFNDDAVSGRGHIWNKTLPFLLKHIFVGSGANTYLLEIPQDDYLYKNYLDMNNNFDVKAHCWYLQQWIETGMLGTIALIIFYVCYFVSSIRILRKITFKENIHRICFALFIGLLTYMIAAIVNDPTVNVASMYWAVLGLGLAVNKMIVEKEHLFDADNDPANSTLELTDNRTTDTMSKTESVSKKSKKSRRKRKQI